MEAYHFKLFALIVILLSACTAPVNNMVTPEPTVITPVMTENPVTQITLTEPTQAPTITEQPLPTVTAEPTDIPTAEPVMDQGTLTPRIIFTMNDSLFAMNSDGSDMIEVHSGLASDFEYLFYDPLNLAIYVNSWEPTLQRIHQAVPVPEFPMNNYGLNFGGQGFAIDSGASKAFLGLYYSGVYAKDLDQNSDWVRIVSAQALAPLLGQRGQLQIDPENQHVYFRTAFNGDCGECRWIYRVDYDGRNLTRLTTANGGDALALDLQAKKMYYSDFPGDNTIKRADLTGSDVEVLLRLPDAYVYVRNIAVDHENSKLYFYLYENVENTKNHAIAKANLDGSAFEIVYEIQSRYQMQGGLALASSLPECGIGWSRLQVGKFTSVSASNPVPNRVREAPSGSATVIAGLPVGSVFKIIDGPVCSSGYVFWKVESEFIPGGIGWTAEGDGEDYYLTDSRLILSSPTEFTSNIFIQNNRYVLQVTADRVLPEPKEFKGGGKIDFIWFIDADMKKSTGQSLRGNDYNIHLTIDEFGWSAHVFPVSHVALTQIVQVNANKIDYSVDQLSAEISFPTYFLPNKNFTWWMDAVSHNSSADWQSKLSFPVSLPEREFSVD
jgi:hypothetical protein